MSRRASKLSARVALWVFAAALAFSPALAQGRRTFDHVFVIVLENHGFDAALNNDLSPFLRGLSRAQGLATQYFGVSHPSLPNYLAMIAGDDFGITDDHPSCFAADLQFYQRCHRTDGDTLVDQLETAGLTWALYAESLPAIGSLRQASPDNGANALYAQKHNPFAYFESIAKNPARLEKMKPLTSLATDLAGGAPNFAFIVPNQCHDGHGLSVCGDPNQLTRDYDAFLETNVGLIRASPHWTENSAIVVTFDEGAGDKADAGGNHLATIVVTKCGGPATHVAPANHYALLGTIEDAFRLPRLRKAMGVPSLMDLFERLNPPCP